MTIQSQLNQHGLGADDLGILIAPDGVQSAFLVLTLGTCSRILPLSFETPPDEFARVAAISGAVFVLVHEDAPRHFVEIARASGLSVGDLRRVGTDPAGMARLAMREGAPIRDTATVRRPTLGDPAIVLATSGTSGEPTASYIAVGEALIGPIATAMGSVAFPRPASFVVDNVAPPASPIAMFRFWLVGPPAA